jgi:hypothetical protein
MGRRGISKVPPRHLPALGGLKAWAKYNPPKQDLGAKYKWIPVCVKKRMPPRRAEGLNIKKTQAGPGG